MKYFREGEKIKLEYEKDLLLVELLQKTEYGADAFCPVSLESVSLVLITVFMCK